MFKLISFKYLIVFLVLVNSFKLVRLGSIFNSAFCFLFDRRLWFVVSTQTVRELFGRIY